MRSPSGLGLCLPEMNFRDDTATRGIFPIEPLKHRVPELRSLRPVMTPQQRKWVGRRVYRPRCFASPIVTALATRVAFSNARFGIVRACLRTWLEFPR